MRLAVSVWEVAQQPRAITLVDEEVLPTSRRSRLRLLAAADEVTEQVFRITTSGVLFWQGV
jgi:hypothetical protein